MTKGFSRAIVWVASAATALSMAAPAMAFQAFPGSAVYEWVGQSGTDNGVAHVVNANAGDTVNMSLTFINRSQDASAQVWYGSDATIDEPGMPHAHEIGVGTARPNDNTPDWLDSSSFVTNGNRFAYYNGPAVFPGQTVTLTWDVKIASDAADGTYKMYTNLVREYDSWFKQMKNNVILPDTDIFWEFVIGEGSGSSADLEGGAGDITVTALSTYGAEQVGEGGDDVNVLAFEVEADDGSDVDLTSIKVELAQQTAADSMDLTDYAADVSVWMGDEEVGRADADEFTENSDDYTKSIALDGAVIRAGEKEQFTLAISALGNLDSGDIDTDDWQIGVSSIRFLDGDGVSTTDSLTLDIDDDTVDDTLEEEFNFATFATANAVELKVTLDSAEDATNEAHVIDIDDVDDTDDEPILAFTIEAEGDSGLNITQIPATITTTGETDEAVLVQNARLWFEGDAIASDTIPTGGAVVFEDLDVDIAAGDFGHFVITVDIQDTTGVADNGDTVQCSLTTANVDAIIAEDDSGERIADADASGSAIGDAHSLYDAGIMVEFVSASAERTFVADAAGEDDQGTYKITFDVTAFDGDMRIDVSSEVGAATATGTYTLADAAVLEGETYTATINGTAVVYTATAADAAGSDAVDTLAIMTGLAAAIDANGTVGPLVNAVVTDGAGTTTITLTATTPGTTGNYTTTASDTSVGGTLTATGAAMTGGAAAVNAAGEGVQFDETGTAGTIPVLSSDILSSNTSDSEDTANTFEVDEDTTRRFTLTVIYSADSVPNDGSLYVSLTSINWGTATDDTNANYYNFNLGDFKTGYLFLNGIA